MRRLTPLLSVLFLAACVDTTGLSAELSKPTTYPGTSAVATVQVVEYADLQCPACKSASENVIPALVSQYGSKINLTFRHFPLSSHIYALAAASASECAADQGKFWEFLKLTYARQDDLPKVAGDRFAPWAEELKLDGELFGRCVESGIKIDAIRAEARAGMDIGVMGTPTFFVNGKVVADGNVGAAIEAALATAGGKL
jgi:protein-disulfide isomerase